MRIGLIGAMDEEVKLLKESMVNLTTKEIASYEFTSGKIEDLEVVLLQSGIGKVNAAIGTTLLNHVYKPSYVINTGSAGGFHPNLNVGDVVISQAVTYHDVDVTAFGYEYGQVPQMPAFFEPDEKLVAIAEACAKQIENIQVVKGVIASGDSFMNDVERIREIKEKLSGLHAVEMEAGAIAQVCFRFQVPFVIIRSLSDIAGKDAPISFDQYLQVAAENSAQHILLMIEELKKHG
ncbi:5'-methylthioadenosine/S-adenosylhomocysteine nucleosidase [Pueribacillus theae]|uniref:5'-methylthioadenosine/S-adenosylhomocysteine nucleosidase n=1 Tax=Pueribacillus theae TaxID=2171751 RepID=A0A2U1K4R4_9BACI|nr:5'-methylthioadenosine/S-adenosylhomocysteine nucleosidase [Pueribacillus theae]PWA12517.1 5'-methylthioadenosine/S-adenosylhomocysteine nucleosidase [Pueribacillus theae]